MSTTFAMAASIAVLLAFLTFLPWSSAAASCQAPVDLTGVRPYLGQPERVLLVPLLKEYNGRNERWPERPALEIGRFYRQRFGAEIIWAEEVRNWRDYYWEIERLKARSGAFDRVILIGHGGFDGPILQRGLLRRELRVEGSEGQAVRTLESQPGVQDLFSVTFNVERNKAFSDYMLTHWEELAVQDEAAARQLLADEERRLEAPDPVCLERQCRGTPSLSTSAGSHLAACETACRNPLFLADSGDRLAPERFVQFAESLRSLTARDGIIILGMCNPGSTTPEPGAPWETTGGILPRSAIANGPHQNYTELLASGTGRVVVGPIGKTSADDIVDRVKLLETGQPQRFLRIISPGCMANERFSDAE